MKMAEGVRGNASLSLDEVYRYTLTRTWTPHLGKAVWIMLNPSTASAWVDDRTIAGCQVFARNWGLGGIVVANLFALRSTDPGNLRKVEDPVGPENDRAILDVIMAPGTQIVMAAWGVHGTLLGRDRHVRKMLQAHGQPVHVLGLTKAGHPIHPLYVRRDTPPVVWPLEAP